MPWYDGRDAARATSRRVPIAADRNLDDFRFPVQYVLRPNLDYRGFAGADRVRRGQARATTIMVLPSGKTQRASSAIDTYDGERRRGVRAAER